MADWRFPKVTGDPGDAPDPEPQPDGPGAPPPPRELGRSSRRRWLVVALGAIGIVLLAGVTITAWRLYPWLRRPAASQAQIDARWEKVQTWAAVPGADGRDDLDAIAAGAHEFRAPAYDEHLPLLEPDQVDVDQAAAVTRLVEWKQKGAPYSGPPCDSTSLGRAAIPLFRLGQLAVFSAKDESALPQIEAVLALARRMRRRGTLVELAVGTSLAKLASQWSHDRGAAFPASYARYRPETPEIHATLAREAVCMVRLVESTGGRGLGFDSPLLGSSGRARPPFGIVSISREISVYKDYQGRLLEQAFAVRSDWKQMADVYERAEIGKPKSLFLEALSLNANVIRRAGEDIDAYRPLTKSGAR